MLRILADGKSINPLRIIAILVILILLTGIAFLGWKYIKIQGELQVNKEALKVRQINENILDFAKIFINQVLRAEKEIDFETRLKLEYAVRDLGDKEILKQWDNFVNSKTESEAQNQVKNLLELLVNKIKID